jgi:drug/metabolite transporter (DMT)-like permease
MTRRRSYSSPSDLTVAALSWRGSSAAAGLGDLTWWHSGRICLFGGYAFQTAGLKLTTPSKAAFLTGLTVVMVPFTGSIVYRVSSRFSDRRLDRHRRYGTHDYRELQSVARGDALVILCALAFAAHIVVVGHYSKMASFEPLAVWQLGTTRRWPGRFLVDREPFFHPNPILWWPCWSLSLLSTALAFTVQAW